MKKLALLIACLVVMTAFVPNVRNNENSRNSGRGFNYHAVVRNSEGIVLPDTVVDLRVSLYPEQYASSPTWVETHSVRTDFTGSFGIRVGRGVRDNSSIVESYSDVDFEAAYYWIKIELREGSNYHVVCDSELPSVIYTEVSHNATLFPAGMIMPFAGDVDHIPEGWMLCDGRELSRSAYSRLFETIGVCWGNGDGSTTFNIPDLRGMFLRGVSGDSGNDPDADSRYNEFGGNQGNGVGTYQDNAIPNIQGTFNGVEGHGMIANGPFRLTEERGIGTGKSDWDNYIIEFNLANVFNPRNLSTEARPINASVNYIIKL